MNNNMNRQGNNQRRRKAPNQKIYVIAVAVLMVMSVIVAIFSASSVKKPTGQPTADPTVTSEAPVTKPPKTSTETKKTNEEKDPPVTKDTKPTPTADPTDACVTTDKTSDSPVIAKLPDFKAPTSGAVVKTHSDSTPVFSTTMNDYRVHLGVDVEASDCDAVLAVADGTISEIWDDPMMGKCLSITHTGGAVSIYKNLAAELPEGIATGVAVKQGDAIGAVGESAITEIADEAHVHYELKIDNKYVNPEEYIDFTAATVNYAE